MSAGRTSCKPLVDAGDRDLAQCDTAHRAAVLPRRAHRIGRGSRTYAVTHLT